MNMERSSFIAVGLCLVFYLGYQQYLSSKYPDYYSGKKPAPVTAENTSPAESGASSATAADSATGSKDVIADALAPALAKLAESDLVIETDTSIYKLSQSDGGIGSVQLKNFFDKQGDNKAPVELLDSPLALQGSVRTDQPQGVRDVFHAERSGRTVRFWRNEGPWTVEHRYTFPETGYGFDVSLVFQNNSPAPADLNAGLLQVERIRITEAGGTWLPGMPEARPRLISMVGTSDRFIDAQTYCEHIDEEGVAVANEKIGFVGFDRHYFLNVITPESQKVGLTSTRVGTTSKANCVVSWRTSQPMGMIATGESVTLNFKAYFGPKIVEVMESFNPALYATLGHGWFDIIAAPLLYAIKGFYNILGNYGLAIILLTVVLKVLFYPLTKAAAVSMHKMKKLNPEMTRLRERYKDDPQTQQRELMKFWQQHQINPMKGCLPILPQIPVFFAFYRVLSSSIELRHAPFFGWITDLAAQDPWFVTPILLTAGMYVQQKLTPMTGMDPTQQKVMMMMPIIFGVMMITLPSGMVLYMLTNTIVSIAQQQWLNRKLEMENA